MLVSRRSVCNLPYCASGADLSIDPEQFPTNGSRARVRKGVKEHDCTTWYVGRTSVANFISNICLSASYRFAQAKNIAKSRAVPDRAREAGSGASPSRLAANERLRWLQCCVFWPVPPYSARRRRSPLSSPPRSHHDRYVRHRRGFTLVASSDTTLAASSDGRGARQLTHSLSS
jgi:hypothetical protein